MSEWISAKERLPEKNKAYLVYKKSGYFDILPFHENRKRLNDYGDNMSGAGFYDFDFDYGHREENDITHWMPLPEPPKEE